MTLADLGALLNFLIVLAFVFLVLSLVASIAVESIAGMLGTRGRLLRDRIGEMFDDAEGAGFAGLLLESPLIRSLRSGDRPPSYIPAELFAQSVQAIIVEHKLTDVRRLPPVLRHLAHAEGFANDNDRAKFRESLITWYERAMERLSGKFRRKSRLTLFIVGFVMAVGLNVDAVTMTSQIWSNRLALDDVTGQIVELHGEVKRTAENENMTPSQVLETNEELQGKVLKLAAEDSALKTLALPVGWTIRDPGCPPPDWKGFENGGVFVKDGKALVCTLEQRSAGMLAGLTAPSDWSVLKIVGWLLTALAVLPGAKFWFDVLGKVIAIRATGPKPITSPKPNADEKPQPEAGGDAKKPG